MATKKYVYFLADAPDYPNEIYASSPAEVKKLILENIPDESQILRIMEVGKQQSNAEKAVAANSDSYKNSQDFFNDIVKTMSVEEKQKPTKPVSSVEFIDDAKSEEKQELTPAEPMVCGAPQPKAEKTPPKYFEEAGVQFKLENGEVYKKAWVGVSTDEYRIINQKTNRILNDDKLRVERIEWVKL